MSKAWYIFMGGDDPFDVLKYYKLSVKHQCLCGDRICAIYATEDGIHPKTPLSPNIQQYIKDALATRLLQPEVPFCTKKYVYLKH